MSDPRDFHCASCGSRAAGNVSARGGCAACGGCFARTSDEPKRPTEPITVDDLLKDAVPCRD